MIIRISNPIIDKNEKTYLQADISAAETSLSVQNNEGFSADDYVVVGKIGDEQTELRKIDSVSGNNTIVTDALIFNHSIDAPITYIKYNQYRVYSSATKTGAYLAVDVATGIEVDQKFSEFDDTAGDSTTWYKFRFYNSTTLEWSDYSDLIQGIGYTDDSVRAIMDRIYIIGNDPNKKAISEEDMLTILNDGYRQAVSRVMTEDHKFYLKKGYIDIENSYNTGTVSIDDGDTTVTGTDTVWDTDWTGKKIAFGEEGYPYTITSVDSTTGITLSRAYNGADDLSDSTYIIYQDEFTVYDASDGEQVEDLRKVEQVIDEDGYEVPEYDFDRSESGYFLKRSGTDFRLCINYELGTSDRTGRWTVMYVYQPSKMDSMADVPELPTGFDSVLENYGLQKLFERIGDTKRSYNYGQAFEKALRSMLKRGTRRTQRPKAFRLRPTRSGGRLNHDRDWYKDIFSR